jgi:nitrate/nitrite-specific signal transduction histidine kinase
VVAVTLLSHALSRPIAQLAEGAEAIGAGRLSHRLPVEGRDELALLSGHFNRMAEQLQDHHAELLGQQALLERKVGERTGELAEANRRLEEANKRLKDLDRLRASCSWPT